MTILARPSEWARTSNATASPAPIANGSHHYFAFLSYSHRDQEMANWLHQALERFVVPSHLVGRITDHGAVPKRLTPIFRDLNELPASNDLGVEIRSAIAASRFLIVLCSPAAARSRWTNAEIEAFKRARPEGCIFAVIVDGEPFATDLAGREEEECLPQALRYRYDRRGRPTTHKAEPLAADLRGTGEVRRLGFLKLVAGMLGLGLDELVQRDTIRRQRRLAAVAGSSLVGMLIATGLAVTAIQARDEARDQRREAEGLVGFMLGDLRTKLQPLGRLDVLDSVGARALAYYEEQDKGGLSDESLAQRSKALTLLGEIAHTRGDMNTAIRLYREAYESTAESLRRDPKNPDRMYEHAQNVFWIGAIDRQQGRLPAAEAAMREYQRLAQSMIAQQPGELRYRLERSYANNNLGVLVLEQRRYREASRILGSELADSEALLASDPGSAAYQDRLLEALAWLSDVREKTGELEDAIGQRERQISLLRQSMTSRGDDKGLQQKLMTAERVLGRLFASRGDVSRGLEHMRNATAIGQKLLATEPSNTEWVQYISDGILELGELQLAMRQLDDAGTSARSGCDMANRLAARDSSVSMWRVDLPVRCFELRARLALARSEPAEAQALSANLAGLMEAERSKAKSPDDRIDLAIAHMLRGDVAARLGERAGARAAWQAGLSVWPKGVELQPRELALHASLLRKVGQISESAAIARKLAGIGYREPDFRKV
jgi:eukaryotic-like serine/threonine-protein kinase